MKRTYTEAEKHALINRYHDGESATAICLQGRIPRSTFYTWLRPTKAASPEPKHPIVDSTEVSS